MDCDIIRSSTSWEVAEEAKENWFPAMVGMISSDSPMMSSAMEVVVQEEELLRDLEEGGGRGGGGLVLLLGAKALETWRAEALHDLERNSIGALGLSGRLEMLAGEYSGRREALRCRVSSMKVGGEKVVK